jgi:hypothetical protein
MEDWGFLEFSEKEIKKSRPWSGTELFLSNGIKTMVLKEANDNPELTSFVMLMEPTVIFKMIKSGHFHKPTFSHSNIIKGLPWTIIRRSIPENYGHFIYNKPHQNLLSTPELLTVFFTEERKINLQLAFDIFSSNKQIFTIKQLQSFVCSNEICKNTLYVPQKTSPAEIMIMVHYKHFFIPNFLIAYKNFDKVDMHKTQMDEEPNDVINVIYKINTNGPALDNNNNSYLLPAYSAFNYESMSLENGVFIITLNQMSGDSFRQEKNDEKFINWLSKKGEISRYKFYCCSILMRRVKDLLSSYDRNHID